MKKRTTLVALVALLCGAIQVTQAEEIDRDVLGGWQLSMTTPDGEEREPVVLIGRQFDRYAAWYVGENGLEALHNVQLTGDTLTGKIVPQEQPDVKVTLSARLLDKNTCKGTGSYTDASGDTGQWSFTGKKLDYKAMGPVETWQLDFTAGDDVRRTPKLYVMQKDGESYAWFEGQHHDLPVQSLQVDNDQVTLKISAESRDGAEIDLVFRGTATEVSVQGEGTYKLGSDSGSFPFTAKLEY